MLNYTMKLGGILAGGSQFLSTALAPPLTPPPTVPRYVKAAPRAAALACLGCRLPRGLLLPPQTQSPVLTVAMWSAAPRGKRGWKTFYAVLKGLILYLQKVRSRPQGGQTSLPSSSCLHFPACPVHDFTI